MDRRVKGFSHAVPASCGIPVCMRSRTSRIIATVILVTCIVRPLVDLFDNWDHAMQTGNESEYNDLPGIDEVKLAESPNALQIIRLGSFCSLAGSNEDR